MRHHIHLLGVGDTDILKGGKEIRKVGRSGWHTEETLNV